MIEIEFSGCHSVADRRATLALYAGEDVSVFSRTGDTHGVLTAPNSKVPNVNIVAITPTSGSDIFVSYLSINRVVVRTGSDWLTKRGHNSGSMTDRIHVRCTPEEKKKFAAFAVATNCSLSELMRQSIFRGLENHQRQQRNRGGK